MSKSNSEISIYYFNIEQFLIFSHILVYNFVNLNI